METPSYRALRRSLIHRKGMAPLVYETGDVVDGYAGLPGDNLEPLNEAARKRQAEATEAFAARRRQAVIRSAPQGEALAEALAELLAGAVSRRATKAKAEAA